VRDYTYIDDIIDGIMGAARRGRGYRIYNLGESMTTSLSRLIELIEAATEKPAVIREQPAQPGDVDHTFADITRARAEIGYAPSITIEEGIPRFVEWYRSERQR
jgi:UDP-glucuronate 4-epimerase